MANDDFILHVEKNGSYDEIHINVAAPAFYVMIEQFVTLIGGTMVPGQIHKKTPQAGQRVVINLHNQNKKLIFNLTHD